jgi:hypothetical protein
MDPAVCDGGHDTYGCQDEKLEEGEVMHVIVSTWTKSW